MPKLPVTAGEAFTSLRFVVIDLGEGDDFIGWGAFYNLKRAEDYARQLSANFTSLIFAVVRKRKNALWSVSSFSEGRRVPKRRPFGP